uniref:Uncharacterized protein n=1 Tax=Populus davidiana TaxID=266767 RepID=A0A6M2EVV7_9ROSI
MATLTGITRSSLKIFSQPLLHPQPLLFFSKGFSAKVFVKGIQVELSNKDEARLGTSRFHFTSAESAQTSLQVSFFSNMTQGFAWFIHFFLSLAS